MYLGLDGFRAFGRTDVADIVEDSSVQFIHWISIIEEFIYKLY